MPWQECYYDKNVTMAWTFLWLNMFIVFDIFFGITLQIYVENTHFCIHPVNNIKSVLITEVLFNCSKTEGKIKTLVYGLYQEHLFRHYITRFPDSKVIRAHHGTLVIRVFP